MRIPYRAALSAAVLWSLADACQASLAIPESLVAVAGRIRIVLKVRVESTRAWDMYKKGHRLAWGERSARMFATSSVPEGRVCRRVREG